MITITLPGEFITEYRNTSKGLEVTFRTTDWDEEKSAAFSDLREAFELSDNEGDELANMLMTTELMRIFKTAIQKSKH